MLDFDDDIGFVYPKQTAPIPYSQSPSLKKYSLSLYSPITQSPNFDNDPISKSLMLGIPRFDCPLPDPKPDINEYPKPILKKCDQTYDENLYKTESFFKFDEENESDTENFNVFSAALRQMKDKSNDWTITTETSDLPKFNYVSLMFDECETMSTNTSMNTRVLAAKYLKNTEMGQTSILLPKLDTDNLFKLYSPSKDTSKKLIYKSVSSSSGQDSGNFEGDDDDDDDDIWLFGKPSLEQSDKKNRTKFVMGNDCSDDEENDDDDYVLDIENIKQLPKLL